jgi:hypothetical protein
LKGENIRSPYTAQFSLGVQQKIYKDFVFNADVIHNFSRKQLTAFNQNAPAPYLRTAFGQTRTVAAANATRPFSIRRRRLPRFRRSGARTF